MNRSLIAPPPRHQDRQILLEEGAFATTIFLWAYDKFGPGDPHDEEKGGLFTWHPETIEMEIESELGSKVPKGNFDRLMAAIAIVTTDLFFKNADRFVKLANILAGDDFDPETFDPATAAECAWAITEAMILEAPEDKEPFCPEIRHYIGKVLKREGYVTAPDVLRIAIDADFSAQVSYDYADDPEMFSAINAVQTGKTQEVNQTLVAGLETLRHQVGCLTLSSGNTTEFLQRIRQTLAAAQAAAQPKE
jgi:hypothetical protein